MSSRQLPHAAVKIRKAIPVTIVTGFLGSGKTTAILDILKSGGPDSRAAVVVNEWGQVALDGAIVSGEYPAIQVREISGGCICCGAGADLERTVSEILDRVKPDRIIVEPSGVAKPGDIMDTLRSFEMSGRVVFDPVVCIVDPARFTQARYIEMPVFRDQVESAEILVANRCDLVERDIVDAFFEKAHALYPPKLAVYATSFGKFPRSFLQAASHEMRSSMPEHRGERPPRCRLDDHESLSQAGWTWSPRTVFSESKLTNILRNEAGRADPVIERAKAVFHTDRGWFLMEIASGAFHQRPIQYRAQNKCQFIADRRRGTDFPALKKALDACIWTDETRLSASPGPGDGAKRKNELEKKRNVEQGGAEQ